MFMLHLAAYAPRLRVPLMSNVRPHCNRRDIRPPMSTFYQLHAVHFHPCCTPYSGLFLAVVPGVSPKLDLSTFTQ